MISPLMPKATAIWLIENTALTFRQIAEFCELHILEIEALANGELDTSMIGFNPIVSSQLTAIEIKRCEADPVTKLQIKQNAYLDNTKIIKTKYTPRAKRQDKPDAILWIIRYYPNISEKDICNLIGTTKMTIHAIKNKTHKNSATIKPHNPVVIGLCSEAELNFMITKTLRENK